jgi:TDG/mug DNA glycosylase family protein
VKRSARPTPKQLQEAIHHKLPDVIAPGLRVLFCGINPGLYSTAARHHFARPGNRFWPALHAAGFTPSLFQPSQDAEMLQFGLGITNIVARTTASAGQLTKDELLRGAGILRRKLARFRPAVLAVVGLGAYRLAFSRPDAVVGLQQDLVASTQVWLLPNTSGLNAHHQPGELARLFRELRTFTASISVPVPPRKQRVTKRPPKT